MDREKRLLLGHRAMGISTLEAQGLTGNPNIDLDYMNVFLGKIQEGQTEYEGEHKILWDYLQKMEIGRIRLRQNADGTEVPGCYVLTFPYRKVPKGEEFLNEEQSIEFNLDSSENVFSRIHESMGALGTRFDWIENFGDFPELQSATGYATHPL